MQQILLVDDSQFNIAVLKEILSKQDYQVDEATHGRIALELIEQKIYDLIILDVIMPGMNGFEVCREIKKHPQYKDIPIIFVTSDEENMLKGFKAGAVDYIPKSYNQTELLARVNTHLKLRMSQRKLVELNQHLEEKVKIRTSALELALQELDSFFYRISHDMRSPITTLKGVTDLLKSIPLQKEAQEILSMLVLQVNKVDRLNRSLVEVGEIRAKNAKKQPLNVYQTIQDILLNIQEECKNNSPLHFRLNIPPDKVLWADRTLLIYALDNIIENSIHHALPSKYRGDIQIEIYFEENPIDFIIHIRDNGPGIDQKLVDRVFDMFIRGTTDPSRFGLGLYKARLAIEKMQGSITCQSCNRDGTQIRVLLPKNIPLSP